MFKALFTPVEINQMTVKNRLAVPPMVTNYGNERGEVTERHIAYLSERARGGFGLITLEAVAVHPQGIGFPKGIGLWSDHQVEGLSRLVRAIHSYGARVSVQLYHSGRQTFGEVIGTQVVSASPIPCPSCKEVPKELTVKDIRELVRCFAKAAERAKIAGADAVEIHGAHGYLVAQFVSPYSNKRVDMYGGPLHNRLRFPLEVVTAIRRVTGPEFAVIYRISPQERVPGGLTLNETLPIVSILAEAGVDAFSVSTGVYGSMPWIIPNYCLPDGLNVDDAKAIRECAGLPVMAAGKIVDPYLADSIVTSGKADIVFMGRASIVDPELPLKAASGALDDIRPCITCNQGCVGGLMGPLGEMSCLVNPSVGHERERCERTSVPKKCLVVGGGPAGLEAARILAERGHHVVLSEKNRDLGGSFRLASLPPQKQPLAKLVRWQTDQAIKAGVTIKTGHEITGQSISDYRPDVIVIATGARHGSFGIPGADGPWVFTASQVLTGQVTTGQRILIMGGGAVGCETADHLLHMGKEVTIVEALPELARDAEASQRFFLLRRLKDLGIREHLNTTIVEVLQDGVLCQSRGKRVELRGFDTIVSALGFVSDNSLVKSISDARAEIHVIGDALEPSTALEAIRDAQVLARSV